VRDLPVRDDQYQLYEAKIAKVSESGIVEAEQLSRLQDTGAVVVRCP